MPRPTGGKQYSMITHNFQRTTPVKDINLHHSKPKEYEIQIQKYIISTQITYRIRKRKKFIVKHPMT